uniref:Chemokine interleukin-8-like domain-containing protein n=1 Tax=Sinocyclocheilus grahami TaxID=75366 RepID=A0A672SFN6_SINGR
MSLLTITLISSILLSLFPHTPAACKFLMETLLLFFALKMFCVMSDGPLNYACCVKYTRNPLPFGAIKGFIEQSSREVCRIDMFLKYVSYDATLIRIFKKYSKNINNVKYYYNLK